MFYLPRLGGYNYDMQKTLNYAYENTSYPVVITYKRMRSITYRFKKTYFAISAPYFTLDSQIIKGLNKFAKRLIEASKKEDEALTDDAVWIFGFKVNYNHDGGSIKFKDGSTLKYLDQEDLIDKIKKMYLDLMIQRTRYYENRMGINKPYRVRLRKMTTRLGTNSLRTYTITYADNLYSYSVDILDSLVVHELAHHFVHQHNDNFYKIVYKYCPNYDKDNRKLKRRIFQ